MINYNTWYKINECGQVVPNIPQERERNFLRSKLVGVVEQPEPYQSIELKEVQIAHNNGESIGWFDASYVLWLFHYEDFKEVDIKVLHGYIDESGNLFIHYLLDGITTNSVQKWIITHSTPYKVQIGKDGWRLKGDKEVKDSDK